MTGSRVYVALQNFEITNRIQISFIFYIIGEWGVNKYTNNRMGQLSIYKYLDKIYKVMQ